MSIKTTTAIEVEVEGVEVNAQLSEDTVSTTLHCVEIEEQESIVEGVKKEYSIIGDGLYASINADEAPEWLTTIIDSVVSNAVANGMVNYDNLVQDVHSAIDALDVAANTYVEQINFDASVNGIISSRLATLNATLENTYATIVDLETAVVNADEALTQRASDITAAYTTEINSRITAVETAFANADSAIASDVTALTTAFDDQASNVAGNSTAVTGLRTYVGLDEAGVPDGTGVLASISTLSSQIAVLGGQSDGYIDYAFYDSFTDIPGATDEATALSLIDDAWTTEEERLSHQSDVVYFRDSANAYWYNGSTNAWGVIANTDWYEAIANASEVQAAADGKVSQFYAWGGTTAPADFVDGSVSVAGDSFKYWLKPSDDQLYYKPDATWTLVPTVPILGSPYVSDGDIALVFDPVTRDHTVYTRHNTTWLQSGTQGIIGQSSWFVDLENEVTGPTGHVATSLATLQTTSEVYADAVGESVENKFEYSSVVGVNGTHYQTGFGLVTTATGGDGTEGNPYDSEFWINAEKFKFTNTNLSGTVTPFTIDASGAAPQITFNGIVNFTNTDMSEYSNAPMYSDSILSAPEKATWRANWPGMMSDYDLMLIRAAEVGVTSGTEYDELVAQKANLEAYLEAAGVWSAPNENYAIIGTQLQDAVNLYQVARQTFFDRILVQGPIEDSSETTIDMLTRVSDFDTFIVNYNDRNDLNGVTPADPVVLEAAVGTTHETNPDGSCNISLKWDFTGTGDAYDIDGFAIYVYKTNGDVAYTFGTDTEKEGIYYIDSTRSEFALLNKSSLSNFVFGVQAYRVVNKTVAIDGVLKSAITLFNTTLPNTYFTEIDIPSPTNVQIAIV